MTYKKFAFDKLEFADVLPQMNGLYGKSSYDSDFNILKFWHIIEEVRMQGFREAIETLEEIDRADNLAKPYIDTLKKVYESGLQANLSGFFLESK
jgi:hypothetical protein